jgi:hypothetical protein
MFSIKYCTYIYMVRASQLLQLKKIGSAQQVSRVLMQNEYAL